MRSKGLLRNVLQLKKIIHVFAIAALLAPMTFAYGADEAPLPWEITADSITHEQEPEKVIAEGNVLLQQFLGESPGGLKIEADRIQYNVNENSVNGSGNLRIVRQPRRTKAP